MPKNPRSNDKGDASRAYKKARRNIVEQMLRNVEGTMAIGGPKVASAVYHGRVFGVPGKSTKQGELKGVDTILTIAGPVINTTNTNADSFTLNLISPGTASYNRVGRKIFMKNLRLRGIAVYEYASRATTGNLAAVPLRMVVVYDQQPSGAVPTFGDIFGTTLQDGTEGSTMIAPVRYDNTQRFRVLCDHLLEPVVEATPTVTGTTMLVTNQYVFDKFIPLRGLETVYSGQNVPCTIADISTGGLYVFFRANSSTANEIDWSIAATSFARLRYTD